MRQIHRKIGPILLASLLLVAAACGSSEDDPEAASGDGDATTTAPTDASPELEALIADAQEEGEVTLYSSNLDEINERVATAFEEAYGITINLVPRESGNILIDRFRAEREAGTESADVFLNTNRAVFDDLSADGLIEDISVETVPGLADYSEDYWTEHDVVASVAPFPVCWNSSRVDPADHGDFATWEDVLLPGDDLKIVMGDVSISAYKTSFDAIREDQGIEFLQEVGEQDITFQSASPAAMQMITSGEADIYFPCPQSLASSSVESGAPVDYKVVYPVSGIELSAGIAKDSPHPAAARLLVSWLTTPEGATVLNENGNGASPAVPDGDEEAGVLPLPTEEDGYVFPKDDEVQDYEEILDALQFQL